MTKSKQSSSSSKLAEKTQKIQRRIVKKSPSPKDFKVINEVRSNVDLVFFEGLTQLFPVSENFSYALPHESDSLVKITTPNGGMDLSGLLKVVSEYGGGNIVKSFQTLLDPSTEVVAGTSEVPVKKISRKKNPTASDGADVEHKEVLSEGTKSNTQESEAVLKEGATRARPKRMRKPHIISPAVGDNLLDIEEAAEEEVNEEETLIARSTRVLPKVASVGAQEADKEEIKSDKVIGKGERIKRRRQKQEARSGPRKRARKAKSSVQEDEDKEEEQKEENPSDQTIGSDVATGTEDEEEKDGLEKEDGEDEGLGQRDGKGIVVAEEEVEAEEEEEDESDESERPLTKKYHLGVLSRHRLTIPHSKMVTRYANVLMGLSSRGVRRYFSSLPPSHEIALVMRNVAELAALSGHSLSRSLHHDSIRKRYRRRIRGVQAKNKLLNNELTSEKKRLTELATMALQLKSDMVRVTKEKQSVEEENERLKAELEKEKSKGKRSRERLVLLHNDLSDLSLKNERLHNTLDDTS
ncbi:hypothetical protein Dimus_024420 [Dionaea muscipula]